MVKKRILTFLVILFANDVFADEQTYLFNERSKKWISATADESCKQVAPGQRYKVIVSSAENPSEQRCATENEYKAFQEYDSKKLKGINQVTFDPDLPPSSVKDKLKNIFVSKDKCVQDQKQLSNIQKMQFEIVSPTSGKKLFDLQKKRDKLTAQKVMIKGLESIREDYENFQKEFSPNAISGKMLNNDFKYVINELNKGIKALDRMAVMQSLLEDFLPNNTPEDIQKKMSAKSRKDVDLSLQNPLSDIDDDNPNFKNDLHDYIWTTCHENKSSNEICTLLTKMEKLGLKDEKIMEEANSDMKEMINGFWNTYKTGYETKDNKGPYYLYEFREVLSSMKFDTDFKGSKAARQLDKFDPRVNKVPTFNEERALAMRNDAIAAADALKTVRENSTVFKNAKEIAKQRDSIQKDFDKISSCLTSTKSGLSSNSCTGVLSNDGRELSSNFSKKIVDLSKKINRNLHMEKDSSLLNLDISSRALKNAINTKELDKEKRKSKRLLSNFFLDLKNASKSSLASRKYGTTNDFFYKSDQDSDKAEKFTFDNIDVIQKELCSDPILDSNFNIDREKLNSCLSAQGIKDKLENTKNNIDNDFANVENELKAIADSKEFQNLEALKSIAISNAKKSCNKKDEKIVSECSTDPTSGLEALRVWSTDTDKILAEVDYQLLGGKDEASEKEQNLLNYCATLDDKSFALASRACTTVTDEYKENQKEEKRKIKSIERHEKFSYTYNPSTGTYLKSKRATTGSMFGSAIARKAPQLISGLMGYQNLKYSTDYMTNQAMMNKYFMHMWTVQQNSYSYYLPQNFYNGAPIYYNPSNTSTSYYSY